MTRVVLQNARLLDGDAPARPANVVISGQRIESVSPAPVAAQPGDRVVDLRGRTVMPGMILGHYHASYLKTGASGKPIGLEASPTLQAVRAATHVRLALDCGFTGVISAGAPHGIDAALKAAIAEGTMIGPHIMAGSCDVSSTGHASDMTFPSYMKIGAKGGINCSDGPEAFRRAVREEIKDGAEIIKVFATDGHVSPNPGSLWVIAPEEFEMVTRTAKERNVKVRAHLANRDAVLFALDIGVHIIDHGDGFDEACIERMLERGAFLAPSLMFPKVVMDAMPDATFLAPIKPDYDAMAAILPRASAAGVKILIGDDYGAFILDHGRYAEELALYVEEIGIPALDVIRWATKYGAEAMGRGADAGVLAAGKIADLIVVDGDPIADIAVLQDRSRLLAIFKEGVAVKDELDAFARQQRVAA